MRQDEQVELLLNQQSGLVLGTNQQEEEGDEAAPFYEATKAGRMIGVGVAVLLLVCFAVMLSSRENRDIEESYMGVTETGSAFMEDGDKGKQNILDWKEIVETSSAAIKTAASNQRALRANFYNSHHASRTNTKKKARLIRHGNIQDKPRIRGHAAVQDRFSEINRFSGGGVNMMDTKEATINANDQMLEPVDGTQETNAEGEAAGSAPAEEAAEDESQIDSFFAEEGVDGGMTVAFWSGAEFDTPDPTIEYSPTQQPSREAPPQTSATKNKQNYFVRPLQFGSQISAEDFGVSSGGKALDTPSKSPIGKPTNHPAVPSMLSSTSLASTSLSWATSPIFEALLEKGNTPGDLSQVSKPDKLAEFIDRSSEGPPPTIPPTDIPSPSPSASPSVQPTTAATTLSPTTMSQPLTSGFESLNHLEAHSLGLIGADPNPSLIELSDQSTAEHSSSTQQSSFHAPSPSLSELSSGSAKVPASPKLPEATISSFGSSENLESDALAINNADSDPELLEFADPTNEEQSSIQQLAHSTSHVSSPPLSVLPSTMPSVLHATATTTEQEKANIFARPGRESTLTQPLREAKNFELQDDQNSEFSSASTSHQPSAQLSPSPISQPLPPTISPTATTSQPQPFVSPLATESPQSSALPSRFPSTQSPPIVSPSTPTSSGRERGRTSIFSRPVQEKRSGSSSLPPPTQFSSQTNEATSMQPAMQSTPRPSLLQSSAPSFAVALTSSSNSSNASTAILSPSPAQSTTATISNTTLPDSTLNESSTSDSNKTFHSPKLMQSTPAPSFIEDEWTMGATALIAHDETLSPTQTPSTRFQPPTVSPMSISAAPLAPMTLNNASSEGAPLSPSMRLDVSRSGTAGASKSLKTTATSLAQLPSTAPTLSRAAVTQRQESPPQEAFVLTSARGATPPPASQTTLEPSQQPSLLPTHSWMPTRAASTNLESSGVFDDALTKWRAKSKAQKTWANFMAHFNQQPSHIPAKGPSPPPTQEPSLLPTHSWMPTRQPSLAPTKEPPSQYPSLLPTYSWMPTRQPSLAPTKEPPSQHPSLLPTYSWMPTRQPSLHLSKDTAPLLSSFSSREATEDAMASEKPQVKDTQPLLSSFSSREAAEDAMLSGKLQTRPLEPSQQPSLLPTYSWLPTRQPSLLPTKQPPPLPLSSSTSLSELTEDTTPKPTPRPSALEPTSEPSLRPTLMPSFAPTSSPETGEPSLSPTVQPSTKKPTQQPSLLPSPSPTRPPEIPEPTPPPLTQEPTSEPSFRPTLTPSFAPTLSPETGEPSGFPTAHPSTMKPTQQPSLPPSPSPTWPPKTSEPTLLPTINPTTLKPTTSAPSLPSTLSPSMPPKASSETLAPSLLPKLQSSTAAPSPEPSEMESSLETWSAEPTTEDEDMALLPTLEPTSETTTLPTDAEANLHSSY